MADYRNITLVLPAETLDEKAYSHVTGSIALTSASIYIYMNSIKVVWIRSTHKHVR